MATTASAAPASSTPSIPEAGKLSIDDKMRFGPLRLAYESAQALAVDIANSVRDLTEQKIVVIAGTGLIADYANLQAGMLTLHGLEEEYQGIASRARRMTAKPGGRFVAEAAEAPAKAPVVAAAAAAAVAAGNPIVAAALGALALVQRDVEFHGVETKVDRLAFELAVAGAVKDRDAAQVFVPDLMLHPLAGVNKSPLRKMLEAVARAKSAAWDAVAPLIRHVLEAEVALDKAVAAKKDDDIKKCQAELDEARRVLEPLNTPLMHADQLFDDLQAQWRKIEDGEQVSTLARMLRVEAVDALNPVYLHCAVVESGGHHRVSRSLWNFLLADDGLSFRGGAIVRWAVLAKDGAIERSGMISTDRRM